MSEPATPVCANCKPGDTSTEREMAVKNLNCDKLYEDVDGCMKAHRGNVTDCRKEWAAFRACHEGRNIQRGDRGENNGDGDGSR